MSLLSRTIRVVVLAAIALGAVAASEAQEIDPVVRGWVKRVREIDEMLRAENWAKGQKNCDGLLGDISKKLVTRGSDLIGKVLVQRAVALEAQGEHDDALWDVHVADTLSASTSRYLAAYGTRGAGLLEEIAGIRETGPQQVVLADSGLGLLALPAASETSGRREASEEIVYMPSDDVKAPEKRRGRNPEYSDALRYGHVEDYVVIQLTIDRDGRPHEPKMHKGGAHPVLLLRTFDAVKDWRFKPAERNGKPVSGYYFLTINFALY